MGKSYSSDLRDRVIAYVGAGHSRRPAARRFGVSESFAVKLMQRGARLGSGAPARQGRPSGGRLLACKDFLVAAVEAKPDITMPELAARLASEHKIKAAAAELSRLMCRLGFTYKKSPDCVGMRTRSNPR